MAADPREMVDDPNRGTSNPNYLNVLSNLVSAVKGQVAGAEKDEVLKEAFAILGVSVLLRYLVSFVHANHSRREN